MAKPPSADLAIARFQVKDTDTMIDVSGTCAAPQQILEVICWSQAAWGLLSCVEEGLRACEHDLPMKVSLLAREHNNNSL